MPAPTKAPSQRAGYRAAIERERQAFSDEGDADGVATCELELMKLRDDIATDVLTGRDVAVLLHATVSTVEGWAPRSILPSLRSVDAGSIPVSTSNRR
jgi:hypothetical protein